MRVNVTQEHIDKGARMSCDGCPIALALKEAGLPDVEVFANRVSRNAFTSDLETWELPTNARAFIQSFDNYRIVEPFHFDIEVQL